MPKPRRGEPPMYAIALTLISRPLGATLDEIALETGSKLPISLIQDLRERHVKHIRLEGNRYKLGKKRE